MKNLKTIQFLLTLSVLTLWFPGCATRNINPPQARANTGYVDFHTGSAPDLIWEVARFDARKGEFKRVFFELEPPPGGVLRLAFAPGPHRFRLTFLNRPIVKPAEVDVEVQDGKVTPVLLTLDEAGAALVETKRESRGGTVYGRYGRRTRIGNDETPVYAISAVPALPVPYQPRELMPYAH